MKIFKKSKLLLASSILAALSGCGSESFTPEEQANTSAPTHGGDITVSFSEKDTFRFLNLLGTVDGRDSGEGSAVDADGDFLSVTDVSITTSGPRAEEIANVGIEMNGVKAGIRSLAIAPMLDTGETHTITVAFNVTDGTNSIPRSLTVTVSGEDFAPVADGDSKGNFTRDAGTGVVDLLQRVVDLDEEALMIKDVVADSANPFNLPFSLNGTDLELDLAAIESDILDGDEVSFNFSYKIADHRFEIERNLTVIILGIVDIPGTPKILNYFLEESVDETDTVQVYDLTQQAVDREGDDIVISGLTLNGSAELPYGVELDGNMLSIDPHAYFNEISATEKKNLEFLFNVADTNGNQSDGERSLVVTINGTETNLIANAMPNYDFEDELLAGDIVADGNLGGFSALGFANGICSTRAIGMDYARTGSYGLRLDGSRCHLLINNIIEDLGNDRRYAFSYGLENKLASDDEGTNPYVPIFASTVPVDSGLDNRFWLGPRYFDLSVDRWMEHVQIISTEDGGNWDGYEGSAVSWGILKFGDPAAIGMNNMDDFSVVEFGHYDLDAHDMLTADVGTFEAAESIVSTGGIVEIQDVEGENMLFVDTTGEASGVTISLPIKSGAIKAGGRYALVMQAQLINHDTLYGADVETQVNYVASLSNGTESIAASLTGSTLGADISSSDIIITEEFGRTADIDWSTETMTLNILLSEENAQYYIDNVRLIAIPR